MTDTLLGDQPVEDTNKNYLEELVGEGKKFKSPEDLARGKFEADSFIETLKRQQDELRADYLKLREESASRAKLEELIGQLETRSQLQPSNEPVKEVKQTPAIDPKDIESLVSNKIQEYELTKKQQDNLNSVRNKLKEHFTESSLKQQLVDLGLTEDDFRSMAMKSPSALYRTLGVEQQERQTFSNPLTSTQKPETFRPKGAQKRTWSYYQEMKAKNPKAYYDPKTNIQMHNDAISLGDEFKDGDFERFG